MSYRPFRRLEWMVNHKEAMKAFEMLLSGTTAEVQLIRARKRYRNKSGISCFSPFDNSIKILHAAGDWSLSNSTYVFPIGSVYLKKQPVVKTDRNVFFVERKKWKGEIEDMIERRSEYFVADSMSPGKYAYQLNKSCLPSRVIRPLSKPM